MSGEEPSEICGRDRAVLRAVAAGRCELRAGCEPVLVVDGVRCADSGVATRLIAAGLARETDRQHDRAAHPGRSGRGEARLGLTSPTGGSMADKPSKSDRIP